MAQRGVSKEFPTLESLWCHPDPCTLTCYGCTQQIHPRPLVRTFRVQSEALAGAQTSTTRILALGRTILIYDRHIKCARDVDYVAVSHVWNKTVSKVQNKEGDQGDIEEARVLALTLPMRIWDGLSQALGAGREMWHDYLSVPQWQEDVKRPILNHVAFIFSQAAFTLVHLDDISRQCVQQMRSGGTIRARAKGVARICNAAWFSRVWTAMEYVRSSSTSVMLDDYKLFEDVHDVFLHEFHSSLDMIVKERGDFYEAETLARDYGMVPWQLGPLTLMRNQKVASFAEAFSMLVRRSCRSNRDFFHALSGILNPKWKTPPDFDKYGDACMAFARDCLRDGDYTPVLMSPRPVDDHPGGIGMGYHDLEIWGLGPLECVPTNSLSVSRAQNPVLKVERIGPVRFIKKLEFRRLHPDILFSYIADMALDFTGPDVDDFVTTVGTRLYGQSTPEILERLMETDRRPFLERTLVDRFNSQGGQEPWQVEMTDKIALALGLSTTDLKSCEGLPPMRFMRAHGGTMHLGPRGALVGITCPSCLGSFLFRAALYVPPSEALGAVAYRIPGLKFRSTLKDGIAILVKEGKVIGRMVWAVPACPCHTAEEVEIQLNPFPERKIHHHRPNVYYSHGL